MTLAETIREAFAVCPHPSADELTEGNCCAECDELAEALRSCSWQELLDHLTAQPCDPDPPYLLKPAAFRYFAPAYLLASLLPSVSSDPEARLFSAAYAFAPGSGTTDFFKAKYRDIFAPEERQAIIDYLTFLVNRQSEEANLSRVRIQHALSEVWAEPHAINYD